MKHFDHKLLNYLETFLTESRKTRFLEVVAQRTKHFTIAVEDVYHMHNASAVMRSCDVFGIQDLHIIEAENSNRIDSEIALGAQKWVDLHRYDSADDCILNLRKKGYQIVATTPHKGDCLLSDYDITKPSCFFFGRETEGLTDHVLKRADSFLKIPMFGFTESLNISVSAAIILQQLTTKLKQSEISWQLSELEMLELRLKWSKKTIKSIEHILKHYEPDE